MKQEQCRSKQPAFIHIFSGRLPFSRLLSPSLAALLALDVCLLACHEAACGLQTSLHRRTSSASLAGRPLIALETPVATGSPQSHLARPSGQSVSSRRLRALPAGPRCLPEWRLPRGQDVRPCMISPASAEREGSARAGAIFGRGDWPIQG